MTTTKLELTQINARLATENAALRMRIAELEGDIERITSVASAVNTMHTAPRAMSQPQWQIERALAMAAAREMAMAARMVVKV